MKIDEKIMYNLEPDCVETDGTVYATLNGVKYYSKPFYDKDGWMYYKEIINTKLKKI